MYLISKCFINISTKKLNNYQKIYNKVIRNLCINKNNENINSIQTKIDLDNIEKLFSLPVSHFQIRNLMKNEYDLSKFAVERTTKLKRNLIESNHPIIDVAKDIFVDNHDKESATRIQSSGGLVVLLIAKILQSIPSFKDDQNIWEKQKVLAECYEMIDKAMYIHHEAILNIPPSTYNHENGDLINSAINFNEFNEDRRLHLLNNGNMLSVLGGDYLFSYALIRLASLIKNATVFDFVGAAIDDFCVSHFKASEKDEKLNKLKRNNVTIPWNGITISDWEEIGGYCTTNLLAYSCQYSALLSNLSSIRFEKAAFELGKNLRLKWNIEDDLRSIIDEDNETFNPLSSIVVIHLQNHPEFLKELKNFAEDENYDNIKIKKILRNSKAINECKKLLDTYSNLALKTHYLFPENEARKSLECIIKSASSLSSSPLLSSHENIRFFQKQ